MLVCDPCITEVSSTDRVEGNVASPRCAVQQGARLGVLCAVFEKACSSKDEYISSSSHPRGFDPVESRSSEIAWNRLTRYTAPSSFYISPQINNLPPKPIPTNHPPLGSLHVPPYQPTDCILPQHDFSRFQTSLRQRCRSRLHLHRRGQSACITRGFQSTLVCNVLCEVLMPRRQQGPTSS